MAEVTVTEEDRTEIKGILLAWRAEGNPNPLLPLNVDIDGDGIVDSFGLDENDEVVIVSGAKLEDTVYVSEGNDIKPNELVD